MRAPLKITASLRARYVQYLAESRNVARRKEIERRLYIPDDRELYTVALKLTLQK